MLDGLIAAAANTVSQEESEETTTEETEEETYRIPPPPATKRRPMTLPDVSTEPVSFQPSAGAQAAAALLKGQEEEVESRPTSKPQPRPGQRPRKGVDIEGPEFSDDVIPVFGDVPEPRASLLQRPVAILTIIMGIAAVGIMIWWQNSGDGPPRFEDFAGTSLNFSSDSPATLEELHARTQILGVRVGQIQKALAGGDPERGTEPVVIPELPEVPRMPFVPFQKRSLSDNEQRQSDDLLQKYSTLVQNGGPDGRNHDKGTVSTYTDYLQQLILTVNARGESRSAVLHELSELTKLIYLLQLKNIRDGDAEDQQTAASILLAAANSGLAVIYSELSTGDMRFAEIFEREESSEQARLLLIRYWHHRSVNRKTADAWLAESLEMIDDEQRDYVKSSIAEVSQIEK